MLLRLPSKLSFLFGQFRYYFRRLVGKAKSTDGHNASLELELQVTPLETSAIVALRNRGAHLNAVYLNGQQFLLSEVKKDEKLE